MKEVSVLVFRFWLVSPSLWCQSFTHESAKGYLFPTELSSAQQGSRIGAGLEWTPRMTGDGTYLICLSASSQRPPLPAVMSLNWLATAAANYFDRILKKPIELNSHKK